MVECEFILKRVHDMKRTYSIMTITDIKELDFVVYTLKEIILFEQEKWNKDILPKLTNFFLHYMKENIIKDLT